MSIQSEADPNSGKYAEDLVVRNYDRFLILRLVQIAELLRSEAPRLAAQSGFLDYWSLVEKLDVETLIRAARQPHLDYWVWSAEHLLRLRAHQRYPDSHPSRCLKHFARLMISWAGVLPEGAEGRVELLGCRTAPILFGRALFIMDEIRGGDVLRWKVTDRILRLSLNARGVIGEVDLVAPAAQWNIGPGGRIRWLSQVEGIPIDVWSSEYAAPAASDEHAAQLQLRLQCALNELDRAARSVVSSFCRCVTHTATERVWTAGLVRLPEDADVCSGRLLVELACRDRIERYLEMSAPEYAGVPLDRCSAIRSRLTQIGASYAADSALAMPPNPETEAQLQALIAHVLPSREGVELLEMIGMTTASLQRDAAPSVEPPLILGECIQKAGVKIALGDSLALRKTRIDSTIRLDWSAIDFLSKIGDDNLEALFRIAAADADQSEASAYCMAASAYILGWYERCERALRYCLAHDSRVEEYWFLLAFCRRYAQDSSAFDQIVFRRQRSAARWCATGGEAA